LFWWCVSDVFNNQVLWTTYEFWVEQGQPNTYWLYMTYLVFSLGIVASLNNLNVLIKAVTLYLGLYMFSTVRYILNIFSDIEEAFSTEDIRALWITTWYFSMWIWILLKLKKEKLHKDLS
tara:strand:- start:1462 stop:1821 length:360 start_codon:yes stop_codon:yes gene_type:complete